MEEIKEKNNHPEQFFDIVTSLPANGSHTDRLLLSIYEALLLRYGNLHWWPGDTPYEVITGAVLTQNTAWSNVEKAISNFKGDLTPETVSAMPIEELAEIIRPAGFFERKAVCLKDVTEWFGRYGYDVDTVRTEPFDNVRAELLSIKGVGPETADSMLLYAFGFPTFVVDAYTIRLCGRFPIASGSGYENVKRYFEKNLPPNTEVYNNFHALIVTNGKEHCRKRPICGGCPLDYICEKRS